MSHFAFLLLRDPAAIVELFAAIVLAGYLLQLLIEHSRETFDSGYPEPPLPLRKGGEGEEYFPHVAFASRERSDQTPESFSTVTGAADGERSWRSLSGRTQASQHLTPRSGDALSPLRFRKKHRAGRKTELGIGEIQVFHRAVFTELSDRGSLFPSRRSAKARREKNLRLFSVGTYVSSKKRSLRKSSALRMRLPEE